MVSDATGCDIGDKIVLNQGGSNEECQEIERVAAGANALYVVGTLAYGHSQGETVVEVPVCPTPTATATPTPTPTPTPPPAEFICTEPPSTRTSNLQMGWNNFVWTGASGVDPATALSYLEGNYNIAYRLDPSGQTFERYVPGRCDEPGLCNMTGINMDDNLLVLVTAPGLVCEIPVVPLSTRIGEAPSLTLDLEPGWNNFVWRGASGADPATALSAIEGNYDVAYRFDSSSRKFERYVPGRCEEPGLCDMARVNKFDALLVKTVFRLRNPALNSATTAHGNTDWHIDTAEEFLFGTDMDGSPTAANHTPDTWAKWHMHLMLSNTAYFYYDSDLTPSGADSDPAGGIDAGAMLFFYAGHGWPESWSTLGNSAGQGNMSLGDWQDGGLLRYYWQCSCEVFAHGPLRCPGVDLDWWYACPGDFDGSADSESMRNVYERWGPVLEPDLRMACGASTPAYCHEYQANAIWNNYNNNGLDVADSFIEGLAEGNDVVPLCITMGGPNAATTPLYDTTFTNQPNTSGTSHYHIQYLSNFASNPASFELDPHQIPELLPIFETRPMPLPQPLSDLEFQCEGDFMTHYGDRGEPWTQVRVSRLSGAVNVLGEQKATVDGPVLEEEEYTERALSFIGEQGWDGKDFAAPMGARFMIETMPVDADADAQGFTVTIDGIQRSQKNVLLTFKRQIDVDGVPVSVLGEGGEMMVQMNNDGSVMNGSIIWRQISGVKEEAPVKTFDEAYEEALEQLEDPQAYELDDWTWGYLEAAGNVEQTELRIVFRFSFVPTDPDALEDYPPQMIEIPGQPQ
jgi:hypothetical protein